jgi:hypothetical protein
MAMRFHRSQRPATQNSTITAMASRAFRSPPSGTHHSMRPTAAGTSAIKTYSTHQLGFLIVPLSIVASSTIQ